MTLEKTYDAIAEQWHTAAEKGARHRPGLQYLLPLLHPGGEVLDVGCGSGLVAKVCLDAGLRVYGIDISENMLAIARRENPTGIFEQRSLEELAHETRTFSAVMAIAVMLHLPRASFLPHLRLLTARCVPRGYLYLVVKQKRADRPDEGIIQEDHLGVTIERFFSFYTLEEVRSACIEAGLTVVFETVVASGRAHWIEVIAQVS